MGVSFTIAKVGSRHRPKVPVTAAEADDDEAREVSGGGEFTGKGDREVNLLGLGPGFADPSVYSAKCEGRRASFSLSLFPNGFSVGKPTEGMLLPLLEDAPELLHPYDRASMTLFSAIEYGWLPGDIFYDIPCNYLNGTVVCEVWDYRRCLSKLENNDSSADEFPKVQRVGLRMGMENVVKDLPSILDDSCTYNDLLEVESRITKALQPDLFLSPNPSLDRLYRPCGKQLDLGICKGRLRIKQHDAPEINVHLADISHARDISKNGRLDSLKPQTDDGGGTFCSDQCAVSTSMPTVQQNDIMTHVSKPVLSVVSKTKNALHCPSSAANEAAVTPGSLPVPDQNIKDTRSGKKDFVSFPEKRVRSELQLMHEPPLKRTKQDMPVPNYILHPFSQSDGIFEKELHKIVTPSKKQIGTQTIVEPMIGDVNFPQFETNGTIFGGVPNVETQRPALVYQVEQCSVKEVGPDTKILGQAQALVDKEDHGQCVGNDTAKQQKSLSFISSLPSQIRCSSTGRFIVKQTKKESTSRKRKSSQGPVVSADDPVRSPVSMLGDNRRMYSRAPYRTCTNTTDLGCHMDKAASLPPASVGTASVGSGIINSLGRENQILRNTKMTSKSQSKATSVNKGARGSPATGSDNIVQLSSDSFSMGSTIVQPLSGCTGLPILERLSKMVTVSTRHGLSNKKNIADENLLCKSICHFPLAPMVDLLVAEDYEELRPLMDKMCMTKFLIGGNRNTCKTRTMTFVRVRYVVRGNIYPSPDFDVWKLILFESGKTADHQVEAGVIFGEEDVIPIVLLPSPHHADLFSVQFSSLMRREGYELQSDQIQPTHTRFADASSSNSVHNGSPVDSKFSCPPPSAVQSLKQVTSYGSGISIRNAPHLLSPHSVHIPTRDHNVVRPNQLEMVACISSMQQHYSHNQSSMSSIQDKLLPNKPISLHDLQLQQHQQQQYQQQQKILLSEMYRLRGTGSGIHLGTHAALALPQIGNNLRYISGFSKSAVGFINEGNSQVQTTSTEKLMQARVKNRRILDGTPIKTLDIGNHTIKEDGSLLDQAQGGSQIGQLQDTGNIWIGPNVPSKHMDRKNSEYLNQMHIQHQEIKPHLRSHRGNLVNLPLKDGATIMSQTTKPTPTSPRETNL